MSKVSQLSAFFTLIHTYITHIMLLQKLLHPLSYSHVKLTREQGRSGNFHLAPHPRKQAGWREVSCQLSVPLPSLEWRPPAYARRLWALKQKFLNLLRHGAHSVSRYHKCFRFPLFFYNKAEMVFNKKFY